LEFLAEFRTDKIIKNIWENIYSINHYKENVHTEKCGYVKNRCEVPIQSNSSIHLLKKFAQKDAFTQENVISWHIKY
jgi:hypothetical protein